MIVFDKVLQKWVPLKESSTPISNPIPAPPKGKR
jgi:hypothetical protein